MPGKLILGANQIGNPIDIPKRSLEAVLCADLLVFEEDKPARQVLKAAGVHKEYLKYNEHKDSDTLEQVKDSLLNGKTVLYMSDQGIATIADPGAALVKMAHEFGCKIVSIPGPCSVTATLQAWPKRIFQYTFFGFLPKSPQDRRKALEKAISGPHPTVFMDTPYRLTPLLQEVEKTVNANRDCMLGIDISGEEEEFIYAKAKNIAGLTSEIKKKNFVLIIDGTGLPNAPRLQKKRR